MSLTPVWITIFGLFGFLALAQVCQSLWFFWTYRVHCNQIGQLQHGSPAQMRRRLEALETTWEETHSKLNNAVARLRQETYRKEKKEAKEAAEDENGPDNGASVLGGKTPLDLQDHRTLWRIFRAQKGEVSQGKQ
jgi:hypothetical protein